MNIANLIVGSYYVSATNQSFDRLKLISDYNNDIIDRLGKLFQTQYCLLMSLSILQSDSQGQILVQPHLI